MNTINRAVRALKAIEPQTPGQGQHFIVCFYLKELLPVARHLKGNVESTNL